MLVLSRKKNEIIAIGDGIFLKVLSIGGSAVKLGIVAPKEVSIRRQEISDKTPRDATRLDRVVSTRIESEVQS